jgi:hypothetical protein
VIEKLVMPPKMDLFTYDTHCESARDVAGRILPDSVLCGLFDAFCKFKTMKSMRDLELVTWYTGDESCEVIGIDSNTPEPVKKMLRRSAKDASDYMGRDDGMDPKVYSCIVPLIKYEKGKVILLVDYKATTESLIDEVNELEIMYRQYEVAAS